MATVLLQIPILINTDIPSFCLTKDDESKKKHTSTGRDEEARFINKVTLLVL